MVVQVPGKGKELLDFSGKIKYTTAEDYGYQENISSYLNNLIRELAFTGNQVLSEKLSGAELVISPNGSTFNCKLNRTANYKPSDTLKVKERGRPSTFVIAFSNPKMPRKWINLELTFFLGDGQTISEDEREKIISVFEKIDNGELEHIKAKENLAKDVSGVVLEGQVLVDGVLGTGPQNNVSLEEEPKPISVIETDESSSENITIPDELLDNLIRSFLTDPYLEVIDEGNGTYFIPETSVDAILKDGAVYAMHKSFITETVIKDNLAMAIVKRKGKGKKVFRLDVTQYIGKLETYEQSTIDLVEYMRNSVPERELQNGGVIQYIPHNLEELRNAMKTTKLAIDDNLRLFYSKVNKGSSRENRTIRKGFTFTLPEGFDRSKEALERQTYTALTNQELGVNITELELIILELTSRYTELEGRWIEIDANNNSLKQSIETKNQELSSMDEAFRQFVEQFNGTQITVDLSTNPEQLIDIISRRIKSLSSIEEQASGKVSDREKLIGEIKEIQGNIDNISDEENGLLAQMDELNEEIQEQTRTLEILKSEKEARRRKLLAQLNELN